MTDYAIDLPVDLNGDDDSGLPWAFLYEARDPAIITRRRVDPGRLGHRPRSRSSR